MQGQIEHNDGRNVEPHPSASANLRKRVLAVFLSIIGILIATAGAYIQCTYLGKTDWQGFAGYEAIFGVFVIVCIVAVFKQTKKS